MEKLGRVEKIHNNMAEIKIYRDSACGDNCAACGLCPNRELLITLPVVSGIETGDEVRLVSDNSGFVKKTGLGYLSLTFLLILGGVLGTKLGSEWLGFVMALAFVGGGVLLIRKFFSRGVEIHIEKLTR